MSEANRKKFRTYLDDKGTTDSINRVLIALYEETEQPENPLEYIKLHLGNPKGVNPDSLRIQNEQLRQEIASLEEQIRSLKNR